MTAKGYDYLSGTQEDINRRLLRKILELEAKSDIKDLVADVEMLKTIVGMDSSKGLYKKIVDLELTVGDSNYGLIKHVEGINTEIGKDTTPGTIKGRIKALEDASNGEE